VKDEQGGVLPAALVRVTSPALIDGPATIMTNDRGQLRFPVLPPGTQVVDVELKGFAPYHEEDLLIGPGTTLERTVVLKLEGVAESIVIEGSGSRIEARGSGIETRFGADYLRTMPYSADTPTDCTCALTGQPVVVQVPRRSFKAGTSVRDTGTSRLTWADPSYASDSGSLSDISICATSTARLAPALPCQERISRTKASRSDMATHAGASIDASVHYESWISPDRPTFVTPFEATTRPHANVPAITFGDLTHTLSTTTVWNLRVGRRSGSSEPDRRGARPARLNCNSARLPDTHHRT
jgi:carboxypeptidase family protein